MIIWRRWVKLNRKKIKYLDARFILFESVKIIVLMLLISYIFFNNILLFFLVIPFAYILARGDVITYIEREKGKVREDFKEYIEFLSGNLNAGYSLENAMLKARDDLKKMHTGRTRLDECLTHIAGKMSYNQKAEELLLWMGEETEIDEIKEFANLIVTAKKYGGNMVKLIRMASKNLNEKCVVSLEIETMIAAKKFEGMIMLISPFAIVGYMRFTNGEYISSIYDNAFGRVVMVVGLISVTIANALIQKITRIEV